MIPLTVRVVPAEVGPFVWPVALDTTGESNEKTEFKVPIRL